MKIAIYDPYLDTIGGGERYFLSIAEHLSDKNDVTIFWDNKEITKAIGERLNIDLDKVVFEENPFINSNFLQKSLALSKYDVLFCLSDGSIPLSFAKKTILHFQVPFHLNRKNNLLDRIKFSRINKIICNSLYTEKNILNSYPINKNKSIVLYPPVDVDKFHPGTKENLILSVGRIGASSGNLHTKKQDIIIEAFKKFVDLGYSNWKLVVTGGTRPEDSDYVDKLKTLANGYPLEILPDTKFETLQDLYSRSKIFWHAAGFGEDLEKYPERAEHFGITTVEAMAAGCVPVVINAGGQVEIVQNGQNGMLWNTTEELVGKTIQIITDGNLSNSLSQNAQKSAQIFSKSNFCAKIDELIS